MIQTLNNRIVAITDEDIRIYRKNKPEIYASLLEELGELAAAMKIKAGLVKHKKEDEPACSEACDLYICAIMMYHVYEGEKLEYFIPEFFGLGENQFDVLAKAASNVGFLADGIYQQEYSELSPNGYVKDHMQRACLKLANFSYTLHFINGGNPEDFYTTTNSKLDKWEKNQKKLTTRSLKPTEIYGQQKSHDFPV